MGASLYENSAVAKDLYEEAANILDWDLAKISFEGPEDLLMETRICQPALFVCGYAIYKLLHDSGKLEDLKVVLGLSLGEITAHAAAGTFDFASGLKIVAERARLMQMACELTDGAMASLIGGNSESIAELCAKYDVEIANFNSPGQTVISGEIKKIEAAVEAASDGEFRMVVPLKVAGAYHSRLMNSAAEKFENYLKNYTFNEPAVKVLSNTTGKAVSGPEEVADLLVKQIVTPVQWVNCMRYAAAEGVTQFFECGPGKVLTGLARRTEKSWKVSSRYEYSDIIL